MSPDAYIPVSTEVGLDAGWWPWLAPDPCPIPRLDLFPRCRRFARLVARLFEVGK